MPPLHRPPRYRPFTPALVLACVVAMASAAAGSELPTALPWQQALRAYLAGLLEVEFELDVVPVRHAAEPVDDETTYRDWLLLGSELRRAPGDHEQPDIRTLGIPAAEYLLSSIEQGTGVAMAPNRHSPMGPAWWLGWDYPGNPYRGARPVALRAIVPAAVDLMMLPGTEGTDDGSDLPALHLVADTYAYLQAAEVLPEDVRQAFEAGIVAAFERLERDGTVVGGESLGLAVATACAHVARAVEDPAIGRRAEALARRVVTERVRPSGAIESDGGYDPQRSGGAAYFLVWAALAAPDGWDFLDEAVERMTLLKTHLLLPEPRGTTCFGPTHFSPEGTADGFQDDYGTRSRDVATAMLVDPGLCLLFGDRPRREGPALPRPASALLPRIREAFAEGPQRRSLNSPLSDDLPEAIAVRWSLDSRPVDLLPIDHDYFRRGTFNRFRRAGPLPEGRVPMRRETTTIRDFDGEFLVARLGGFGAVIHAGPIRPGAEPRGFSGGALSGLWTPASGAVILGRVHDPATSAEPPDTWDNWWRWQTHALAGTGSGGRPFSSARLERAAFTGLEWQVDADRASISLSAPLHVAGNASSDAVVEGALSGTVTYSRRFDIDVNGVTIEGRLTGDGTDTVGRLCEILPVFDGVPVPGETAGPEAALFADTGSGWKPLEADSASGVRRVRIDRLEGAVEIAFERPQRVGLAPEAGSNCRNLLVELVAGEPQPLTDLGVVYTIRPLITRR